MSHRRYSPLHAIARVVAVAALLAAAAPPGAGAGPWTIETADATSGAGAYASLMIDALGQPHVSYGAPVQLRHAVRVGGIWSWEWAIPPFGTTVAERLSGPTAAATAGPTTIQLINIPETALALDSDGKPAIAWANSGDSKYLSFIRMLGSTWQPVEGPDPSYAGEMPAIAFDPLGRPCVAYHAIGYQGGGDRGLRLSTLTGTAWAVDTVDATPQAGSWPSLAFAPNGDPCVLYDSGATLEYAERSGGTWTIETVDAAGQCGPGALAFDPAGDAHAVYRRWPGTGDIVHGVRHAGIWSAEPVDANGLLASLALDRNGRPRAAYARSSDYALRYAAQDGGVWTVETVAPKCFGTSIALMSDGTPLIAYSGGPASGGALRVAFGTSTSGVAPRTDAAVAAFGPAAPQPARIGEPLAIAMSLRVPQAVALAVFDVTGRPVDRRAAQPAAAGASVVHWRPRLPAPGLYFIRMQGAAGAAGVTRLVTVR